MPRGRPKLSLEVSDDERKQLEGIARSRFIPSALNQRANIVLACASGASNSEVSDKYGVSRLTVGKWRNRFVEKRIAGLYDELSSGAPRSISDEKIAKLISTTLKTKPADGATHWSVRSIAAKKAISKTSVHRYFQAFGIQPHR